MADINIRMVFNLETGKKDILIDYESDEDSLPFEHEKKHREIVQHLLGKGILQPNEVGNVIVERGGNTNRAPGNQNETPQHEPEAVGNAG